MRGRPLRHEWGLREGDISPQKYQVAVTDPDACRWCNERFQPGQRRFVILDFSDDYIARKCLASVCKPCFTQSKEHRRKYCDEQGRIWCEKPLFGGPGRWVPDESGAWIERVDRDCPGCGEPINTPSPYSSYTGAWRIFRWQVCSDRCYQRAYRKRRRRYGNGSSISWKQSYCHPHYHCEACDQALDPKLRGDARFCSNKCRQWHYRRRKAQRR